MDQHTQQLFEVLLRFNTRWDKPLACRALRRGSGATRGAECRPRSGLWWPPAGLGTAAGAPEAVCSWRAYRIGQAVMFSSSRECGTVTDVQQHVDVVLSLQVHPFEREVSLGFLEWRATLKRRLSPSCWIRRTFSCRRILEPMRRFLAHAEVKPPICARKP